MHAGVLALVRAVFDWCRESTERGFVVHCMSHVARFQAISIRCRSTDGTSLTLLSFSLLIQFPSAQQFQQCCLLFRPTLVYSQQHKCQPLTTFNHACPPRQSSMRIMHRPLICDINVVRVEPISGAAAPTDVISQRGHPCACSNMHLDFFSSLISLFSTQSVSEVCSNLVFR